ncbi:MAG: hypothetical protein RRA51_04615, partial [Armatimonadota bacterium]|nr:hypothetical protein [Armatimonadota bacterium]
RLLSAEIFGSAMALFSRKNYRYSPFAAVLPVANRQSPFAVHYSLFAICYSLSFLARQEPRTPMMSPTKVGAQFLRHQLLTGVRSMNGHGGEVFNTKSQMDFGTLLVR